MHLSDKSTSHAISRDMTKSITISYDKTAHQLSIRSHGLCERKVHGRTVISTTKGLNADAREVREAAKRSKGIIVCSDVKGIRILNDPFCTLPLYYIDTATNFTASSDPQVLIDYPTHPYDEVGVWETLLLNSPLWNRTSYKDVKFLPAACELNVGNEVRLHRYWNFEFEPASTSFNQKTFFSNFDDLLSQKFSEIKGGALCMGLSGGNDSRLAAHYLAKNKERFSEIELVTYATHPNSNEFRYACEVASVLNLTTPRLHLLKDTHYLDALEYLPHWSAGQINNQHGHLASFLKKSSVLTIDKVHLSNYYTDAVFGFDCGPAQSLNDFRNSAVYQTIKNAPHISEFIRDEILGDCRLALSPAPGSEGFFSTLNEFKYVVERNPRFHLSLAFIQSQFMATTLPFADLDVLTMAMQAPMTVRAHKGILDNLLKQVNTHIASIGSSANTEYFYGAKSRLRNGTIAERLEFRKFRFQNMSTQLLAKLTGGTLRFGNPYQTEDQISIYRRSFTHMSTAVLGNEALRECLGATAIDNMFKDELVLRNLAQRFHLISFHHLSKGKD